MQRFPRIYYTDRKAIQQSPQVQQKSPYEQKQQNSKPHLCSLFHAGTAPGTVCQISLHTEADSRYNPAIHRRLQLPGLCKAPGQYQAQSPGHAAARTRNIPQNLRRTETTKQQMGHKPIQTQSRQRRKETPDIFSKQTKALFYSLIHLFFLS